MAEYPRPSTAGRSANMRANRRTDTKPELALRRALHGLGYRYRKDYRIDLEGRRVRPDVVFTARRVAVFVDGCFWHACPEHGGRPAVNDWYWSPKLRKNVERDRKADETLETAGWRVVRIWEHESLEAAVAAVVAVVGAASTSPPAQATGPQPPGTEVTSTPSPGTQSGSSAGPPGSGAGPPGSGAGPPGSGAGPPGSGADPPGTQPPRPLSLSGRRPARGRSASSRQPPRIPPD